MRNFDYEKLKNIKWDNEILSLVALIHEYKGRQQLYLKQQPQNLDRLIEIAKIQSTDSSNAIEGIRTTGTRLKQLCAEKTAPKNRDEKEIMGYRDVLNLIHENYEYIPLNSNYILQLHRDLFKYSETGIGGQFKNVQNYISITDAKGNSSVLFIPLPPFETPEAVSEICDNFNRAAGNNVTDPLILIPVFIHDFLCIHPFNDGNGRMSRLLTTLLLYRSGYFVGRYISLESKIEAHKDLYYDSLQECQNGWHEGTEDKSSFIKYILRTVLSAYRDFEERINLISENLPAEETVLKAAYNKIGKFTKNDIMEFCPSIAQSTIEKALKTLVEKGKLSRHGAGKSTFYLRTDL